MPLSTEETITLAERTAKAVAKATTKDEVIVVWKDAYLSLGHKAIAKMLIGTFDIEAWAKKQRASATT